MNKDTNTSFDNRSMLSFANNLEQNKSKELKNLMSNDRSILKIMSADIEQRLQFMQMQHNQLHTLQKLSQVCITFNQAISANKNTNTNYLLTQLKEVEFTNLSHAMNQGLSECLESISNKPLDVALNTIKALLEDLINLQAKKILITDLQITKVRESVDIHTNHYIDIIKQAQQNQDIDSDTISQQMDFLNTVKKEIEYYFQKRNDFNATSWISTI